MKKLFFFLFALTMSLYTFGQKTKVCSSVVTEGVESSGVIATSEFFGGTQSDSPALETTALILPYTNATSTANPAPSNGALYQRAEYLITAAEMATAGFLSGTNINSIGWFNQVGGIGTLNGTLNIYLKNSGDATYLLGTNWNVAGFDLVSTNTSWTTPVNANYYLVNFTGGTAFTYTGGSIYVAYEFSSPTGIVGTTVETIGCNNTFAASLRRATSATALPVALTTSSAFRPVTIFGSSTLSDAVGISNIYTLGKVPMPLGTPTPIGVRVTNTSTSSATFDLTITVKDVATSTVRYTSTQTGITLAAGISGTTSFTGWTPTLSENVTITATAVVTGETFTFNNSMSSTSNVNANLFSYVYGNPTPNTSYGFTYPGYSIFAAKYTMNGAGVVSGANLFIGNSNGLSAGTTISAVVLNSAGVIVGTSAPYVILAADYGLPKSFTFPVPPVFNNQIFYVGMLTSAGSAQHWPLGVFYDVPPRGGINYTFPAAGGTALESTAPYRYGIEAQVAAYAGVDNPTAFTATPFSTTQINLSWALNANNNNVLLAFSTTSVFGTPVNGTTYTAGDPITGGGTVLQYNNLTAFSHTLLSPATTYYYKAWSSDGSTYSVGTTANANTLCNPTVAPWSEGFEGTLFQPMCWSLSAGSPAWIRSPLASGYGTGTASAEANFFNIDVTTVPFDMITLQFDATAMTTPALKFDYAYAAYDTISVDQLEVLTSTDNGLNYSSLVVMTGGSLGDMVTAGTLKTSFTPTAAQWATKRLALPAGTNKVKFAASSDYGNNLYVDNVGVFQLYAHDAGVSSIDLSQIVTLGSISPKATITNFGNNTETFDVTMTIGGYTSTKTVTALAAFASLQVTFDPWTNSVGDYTVNVCTALTSPVADENSANDCKSQPLKVLDLNKQVYAFNTFKGTGTDPVGPTSFSLSTPGTLNSIADQSTLKSVYGGTWANGTWYGTTTNTTAPYDFITINTITGARTVLGDLGYSMSGLSYNKATNTMYALNYADPNTNLYTVDMATGATTLVGTASGVLLINLAINSAGVCYAVDILGDNLGTIDLATGAFTVVGPIGFNANYAQDMEFDRVTGDLYMAAYGTAGWLGWVNTTTGTVIKIGDFEGGAEITGFAIPYPFIEPFVSVSGVVTSEDNNCYNATNTITVAGTSSFEVQNGGSAIFIAGTMISFLPGTTIAAGGYMHGYISTGSYCGGITPALPAVAAGQEEPVIGLEQAFFSIYPNPTNGNFTLVQKGDKQYGNVSVEVYGIRGDKVLSSSMIGEKKHEFLTSALPAGLYFVKVVADDYTETIKLIKTR